MTDVRRLHLFEDNERADSMKDKKDTMVLMLYSMYIVIVWVFVGSN